MHLASACDERVLDREARCSGPQEKRLVELTQHTRHSRDSETEAYHSLEHATAFAILHRSPKIKHDGRQEKRCSHGRSRGQPVDSESASEFSTSALHKIGGSGCQQTETKQTGITILFVNSCSGFPALFPSQRKPSAIHHLPPEVQRLARVAPFRR